MTGERKEICELTASVDVDLDCPTLAVLACVGAVVDGALGLELVGGVTPWGSAGAADMARTWRARTEQRALVETILMNVEKSG